MNKIIFLLTLCIAVSAVEQPEEIINEVLHEWITARKSRVVVSGPQEGLGLRELENGERVRDVSPASVAVHHPTELEIANRQFMEELLKSGSPRLKALFIQGKVIDEFRLVKATLKQIKGKPENQLILKEDYWDKKLVIVEKRMKAIGEVLEAAAE